MPLKEGCVRVCQRLLIKHTITQLVLTAIISERKVYRPRSTLSDVQTDWRCRKSSFAKVSVIPRYDVHNSHTCFVAAIAQVCVEEQSQQVSANSVGHIPHISSSVIMCFQCRLFTSVFAVTEAERHGGPVGLKSVLLRQT